MQQVAYKAYGDVAHRTADDRQIEHALFKQITTALEGVLASENSSASARADAVSRNLQLWTALAADLAHPENKLPQELKANLIYLAEFTRRTSMSILAGEDGVEDLVEVNQSVMAGLA